MPRTKKRKTAEPLYEVEAIVGRRKDESGKWLYKVHWKVRPGRLTYIKNSAATGSPLPSGPPPDLAPSLGLSRRLLPSHACRLSARRPAAGLRGRRRYVGAARPHHELR